MRLLQASVLKLRRRPATYRTALVLAGLLAFIYLSIGLSASRFPDPAARASLEPMLKLPVAYGGLASILLIFGGMAGAAYAGIVAASEWSWNTFRVALTRGESRVRYTVVLFLAIALLVIVAWVLLYLLGVVMVLVAALLAGMSAAGSPLDASNLGPFAAVVASGGLAILMEVSIGFAVAFITRSPVAGIATVAGLYFMEQLAALVIPPEVLRLAPITAANSLVSAAAGAAPADPTGALIVTTAYLLLAIGAASLVARRAQVP